MRIDTQYGALEVTQQGREVNVRIPADGERKERGVSIAQCDALIVATALMGYPTVKEAEEQLADWLGVA